MTTVPHFKVRFAGDIFVDTPNLVVYEDEPVLRLDRRETDGALEIDMDIYDADGRNVGAIRAGELEDGKPAKVEVSSGESQFLVKDLETGRTICDIRRRAHSREADIDVSVQMFMPDGFLVHANPAQSNLAPYSRERQTVAKTRKAALKYDAGG